MLDLQVASWVVNANIGFACFMRFKCVLIKHSCHTRDTLAHAAPCWDIVLIRGGDILLEFTSLFSKNEDLLVSHKVSVVTIDHGSLDHVLYLALRFCPIVLINKMEAWGETSWHGEGERNLIITYVKHWHSEDKNRAWIPEDILFVPALNFNSCCLLAPIYLMCACLSLLEAKLFDSSDCNHDLSWVAWSCASNGNSTCYLRARVVQLLVCLHNHVTNVWLATRINVSHIYF